MQHNHLNHNAIQQSLSKPSLSKKPLSKLILGLYLSLGLTTVAHVKSLMIVGNDERLTWDNQGAILVLPDEGRDTVSIYDIDRTKNPKTP